MELESLEIENFRSFRGVHEMEFADRLPGLYFLTGDNRTEPTLGANGTGKTTLWEAVFWCLYGKTSRNLKGKAVRTWGADGPCRTVLRFKVGPVHYVLERSWRPNRLLLAMDGADFKVVEQETIAKILKLTPEMFQHSMMIGQFSTMFFELPPASKSAIFSELMDLNVWIESSKKSSRVVTELEDELYEIEIEKANVTGQREQLKNQIHEEKIEIADFKAEKKKRLKKLRSSIETEQAKQIDVEKDLVKEKTREKAARKKLGECERIDTKIAKGIDRNRDKFEGVQTALATVGERKRSLEEELERFTGVTDICPYCLQKVSPTHLKKERKRVTTELKEILLEADELLTELEESRNRLDTAILKEQENNERKQDLNEDLNEINDYIQNLKNMEDGCGEEIESLRYEIAELKKDTHQEISLSKKREQLRELTVRKKELQSKCDSIGQKIVATKFWVKGFKDIRLMLMSEAIKTFEIEVNNNLMQLGLEDWIVTFDIERETQSGGVSRGFQMFVHSPESEDPVPWESVSGGETARLRLAGTMGLSNLILGRMGIVSNIEIWDEPSQFLSEEGIEDLLNVLYHRARSLGKQIWLVDHRSLDYGNFEETLIVKKTKKRGSFIQ